MLVQYMNKSGHLLVLAKLNETFIESLGFDPNYEIIKMGFFYNGIITGQEELY